MSLLTKSLAKVKSPVEAAQLVQDWQASGQKVVFTNGCFDILHLGHFDYLARARDLGDRLVVGLNGDASVRRLKGPSRPIQDQATRKLALASLLYVDIVVIFEADTPLDLITLIKPDILVKGGDYEIKDIVGASQVQANGGQVQTIPFVPGYSTSKIETKIKETH